MGWRGTGWGLFVVLTVGGCRKPTTEPITADTATAVPSASTKTDDVEVTFVLKHPEVGNKIQDAENSTMEMHVVRGDKHFDSSTIRSFEA